jgi:hypothetical protein
MHLLKAIGKKGAAAIEFALVAPIFFLLLFGIIEFGLTVFADSTLQQSVRLAARECMTRECSEPEFRGVMQRYMGGLYRDAPDLVISARMTPRIVNDTFRPGGLFPPEIMPLINNPGSLFTNIAPYPPANSQSGMVMIYGAKYKWGGFTGLMAPFLPADIYAITIVRNEF